MSTNTPSSTLTPLLSTEELAAQFAKVKPPMTQHEAMIEASRCLFCHDAPCTIACPSDIDIPMFIRQISTGNTDGAARTIFSQNILGKSCAYACPTQVLCEGACVYHGLNEKPIDIGRLQGFASDHAIANDRHFVEAGPSTGRKVAVIGAGPAGLSCAHELTRLGHAVTVFEASPEAGGLNRYGVAPYKLDNTDVAQEVAYVQAIGFTIKTNTRVVVDATQKHSQDITLAELEAEYDALFLGMGLGQSHRLGIPGETLPGVQGAAEFIYHLKEANQAVQVGQRVVVIGAGNTAIDAAVESAKLGAHVTMVYRRRAEDQSAYAFEVDHARIAGVQFEYLTSPVAILGDTHVTGLQCHRNKATASPNGKADITTIPNSAFVIPCDMVLLATGQEKQTAFYQHIPSLTIDKNGRIKVNAQFQTTVPRIFAGGDCVNGGKEVVNAVAHGRDAARGIDSWLKEAR